MKTLLLTSLMALGTATATQASVVFAFEEVGADVIGTLSGSLDLTGLSFTLTNKSGIGIQASTGTLFSGVDALHGEAMQVDGVLPPGWSFGSGGLSLATATTGDVFALNNLSGQLRLILGADYSSNDPLSGTLLFAGQSFLSMGITPGAYAFDLPADTVTISFGVAAVPLPASGLLLAGTLGFGAMAARRRRKPARA